MNEKLILLLTCTLLLSRLEVSGEIVHQSNSLALKVIT